MEAWIVEALFALVFIRALSAYAIRRDPLQRDVTLVFTAMAVLIVVGLLRRYLPAPAPVIDKVTSALLLAQPYLTLRLAARVRRIPTWLMATAFVSWLVSSALLVPFGNPLPPWAVLAVVA